MQFSIRTLLAFMAFLGPTFFTEVGALPIRSDASDTALAQRMRHQLNLVFHVPFLDQLSPVFHIPFLDQLERKRRNHSVTKTTVAEHQIHALPPYPPIKRDSNNLLDLSEDNFNATELLSESRLSPADKKLIALLEPHLNKTMSVGDVLSMMVDVMNNTNIIVDAGRVLPVSPKDWTSTVLQHSKPASQINYLDPQITGLPAHSHTITVEEAREIVEVICRSIRTPRTGPPYMIPWQCYPSPARIPPITAAGPLVDLPHHIPLPVWVNTATFNIDGDKEHLA